MISRQTISQVLDRCNILDIAQDCCTDLKKAGTVYRCCCPFHTERTPSFTVFPATNTYKCFGCGEGGNAVSLIMKSKNVSYPEAIHDLARRYGVDVEETEVSEKEEREHKIRQAMWAANERLAKVYEQQLAKHPGARNYAYGRWGEDFCRLMGVGYCPKGSKLVDEARISPELCEQLHLKNKGGYDFYGGRVTIPIRDRQQHVIGFTARMFPDEEDTAKYFNSRQSLVYDKGRSLFGVNLAWKEASKRDKLYLVEGAPDCMRLQSIGVLNAVAPLGTAWTKEHLDTVKRMTSNVCFIPDSDPPKSGERFGPGIKNVIKSGEFAVCEGLTVSVRQIPMSEGKQDPDSYCTSRTKFNDLEEVSFVEWLASLLFTESMTTDEEVRAIERVASVMAHIQDDTVVDRLTSKLTRWAKDKKMWKKQVEKQKKELDQERLRQKEQKETHLYRQFGFNVSDDNTYYSYRDDGSYYSWSNFTMRPLFHIKDAVTPKRLYEIKNSDGEEEMVELRQEELVGITKFKIRIEGLGNYLWKAGSGELEKLKAYLYKSTKSAVEVKQLGWQHKQKVYAFGNGIFDGKQFVKVDEYGIVPVEQGYLYLPALSKLYADESKLFDFEKRFVHLGLSSVTMREFTQQLATVFGDNGRLSFIYTLASIFRDVVRGSTAGFPILNLFGPRGTGKTQMARALSSMFVTESKIPNLKSTTFAALNEEIAKTSDALVHIDEYKNDIDPRFIEILKGIWDGTGRNRKNMDLDKKTEMTPVESGVILSGQEMPTADDALFSRLMFLTFSKATFTPEEKANYDKLMSMAKAGNTHLTLEILSKRSKVVAAFPSMFRQTQSDLLEVSGNVKIDDRILNNWTTPLAVFRTLEAYIDTPFNYRYMLELCSRSMVYQNSLSKQNNELSTFWKTFNFLKTEGELIEGGDYKIKYTYRLKTNRVNTDWGEPHAVLIFHKTRVFELYRLQGRKQGENIIPEGSLKYYLENSPEFLGYKGAYRFRNYVRGVAVTKNGKESSSTYAAYCFDYQALRKLYGINLENEESEMNGSGDDDDGTQEPASAPAPASSEAKQEELPF